MSTSSAPVDMATLDFISYPPVSEGMYQALYKRKSGKDWFFDDPIEIVNGKYDEESDTGPREHYKALRRRYGTLKIYGTPNSGFLFGFRDGKDAIETYVIEGGHRKSNIGNNQEVRDRIYDDIIGES